MAKGNTKKIEVEVPEVFTAHLAAFLHNNPHVKKVWVNANGEYHLSAKEGFDEYAVDDHLKSLDEYPVPVVEAPPGNPQLEALQKELEELKAENTILKEELAAAKAAAIPAGGEAGA